MSSPFDFANPQNAEDEGDDYRPSRRSSGPPKSRMVYIILALFLGYIGIHNFYAGRFLPGLFQLIGVPLIGIILIVLTFLTGVAALLLVPFAFFAFLWPILEIVFVKKDGRGKWMV